MTISPAPRFPEDPGTIFERKFAAAAPGQSGPLRFEEGVATDTDVPNDFALGASQGYAAAPGRPNRNANVFEKLPDETMRERAHVGSAAWVEAPTMLSDFSQGAFADYGTIEFQEVVRSGGHQLRRNPTVVRD